MKKKQKSTKNCSFVKKNNKWEVKERFYRGCKEIGGRNCGGRIRK